VENVNRLGSMITNGARCTSNIKSIIAMAKVAFNKKKDYFISKLDLNLREKLVKFYIWSIASYKQTNSVALVRERTIQTERPPPVGEVSANFCG
jgi:hypothetical protein